MARNIFYQYADLHKIVNSYVEPFEKDFGKPNKKIDTFFNHETSYMLINQCRIYLNAKKIIIITSSELHIIPFDSIMGYDIVDKNKSSVPLCSATTTIIKTDTGDMVKRAVIGGAVAGGVGAILGGLTAQKTTTQSISNIYDNIPEIEVVIKINDLISPTIKIPFEDNGKTAKEFAESLNVIIKRNAENEISNDSSVTSYSLALEIRGNALGFTSTDPFRNMSTAQFDDKKLGETIASFLIISALVFVFCLMRCS